jgi:CRISPR-associated protein Csd1
MGLNIAETDPGYRLGRLLAVLERLQEKAINPSSTIVDRYYGACSTRPGTVFPTLIKLAQHHFGKTNSAGWFQAQLGEVLDGIGRFPPTLNLEEQGMFAIGYYQQRQEFYKKKDDEPKKKETKEEKPE